MKRLAIILLSLCLICGAGCIKIEVQIPQNTEEPILIAETSEAPQIQSTEEPIEPTEAPIEPTEEPYQPDLSALPMYFNAYLNGNSAPEGEMFRFDLDYDGTEEVISYRMDYDLNSVTIIAGERSVVLDRGAELIDATLIDLDPNTPYADLVIEIDMASDDLITFELRPEGDRLVIGTSVECGCYWKDGSMWRSERSELLGSRSGDRPCHGEDFTPDDEWLKDSYIPTEDEIEDEFDSMTEYGTILHAVRDIPCKVEGAVATIPAGTYLYVIAIHESQRKVRVQTLDDLIAEIEFTFDDDDWPPMINGVHQDEYFDLVFYCD